MKKIAVLNLLLPIFCLGFSGYALGDITINHDTTFTGTITVTQDIILSDSATLSVSAGTNLLMGKGVSIKGSSNCHILLQGTASNKVVVKSSIPGTYWGAFNVKGLSASVEIYYADIQSGQVLAYDSSSMLIQDSYLHDYLKMPTKNIAYSSNAAFVTLERCHISNYWQVNFYNTPVLIENCLLEFMLEDGIDLDNSPSATIRNCTLRNGFCEKGKVHSIDAIDLGKFDMNGIGSSADVQNCLVYNITDKGVSSGEKCRHVTVTNSVFYHCGSGATIKDSSLAEVTNNTIVSCEYGVECVEKNPGMGGGHTTGYNDILWNNGTAVYLDNDGTLSLAYSDITFNGIFPGTGNINSYPMFADTLTNNFQLLFGSPCIATGSAGADMGAIYPVGGISFNTDYINIGIPYSTEVLNGDSAIFIHWITGDSIHFVNLEFSSDNGNTWTSIAQNVNAQDGAYAWTTPDIYSSKCFVRITDVSNGARSSTQNLPFSIIPQGNKSLPPTFSYPAGFYAFSVGLQLETQEASKIYYTLDGSDPTDQSAEYSSPILLNQDYIDTGYVEQNITSTNPPQFPLSSIRTAPVSQIGPNPALWYMPTGKISRIKVVKARSYIPGRGLGDVVTNSYLINTDGTLNPGNLPVISLATDKENFFDYYSGIYIPGATFTGYCFTGNYEISGRISERPVHFEYFEPGKPRILSMNIGARARGEWIRSLGQKALGLYARSEYDSLNYFNYSFFPGYRKTSTSGLMNSFKRLILRNDGNNWGWWQTTMMKDATTQSLFDHMNLKYQAYRPSIVFLDGEYWGIHNIRELPDQRNIALTYYMNPDNITIMEHNLDGENQLVAGLESDVADFIALRNFTSQQDLNLSSNYEYVKSRIDVENLADMWVANFYMCRANTDHNCGFWKQSGSVLDPNAPAGKDGRWRWLVYDFDYSFSKLSFNIMTFLQGNDLNNKYLFFRLLTNDSFKTLFISRYLDMVNSSFKPSRVIERINANSDVIDPEINRHLKRWGNPASKQWWEAGIDSLRNFALIRPALAYAEMQGFFGLSTVSSIALNVNDVAQGKVKINTIRIDAALPGVNTPPYPWTGSYFKNFPITLIAQPEPGYRFWKWLETGLTTDTLSIILTGDSLFTAVFENDPDWHPVTYPHVFINEVSASNHTVVDDHGGNPDWLELYNPNDSAVDLAGWYISNEKEYQMKHRFVSSDSTKIPGHGFLLLYADNEPSQGSTHVAFKLDAGGDDIFLTAPDGITFIDSVSFGFQVTDTSYGRYPDGSSSWEFFSYTTPGASNIHIDVTEIPSHPGLQVYPNPLSSGVLHFSRHVTFRLYNDLGQELMFLKDADEADISGLRKGCYFIRTEDGITLKLIKVN